MMDFSFSLCSLWIIRPVIHIKIIVALSASFTFPLSFTISSSWRWLFRWILPPPNIINTPLLVVITTSILYYSFHFSWPIPSHRTWRVLPLLLPTNFHLLEFLFSGNFQLYIPTTDIHPILLYQQRLIFLWYFDNAPAWKSLPLINENQLFSFYLYLWRQNLQYLSRKWLERQPNNFVILGSLLLLK